MAHNSYQHAQIMQMQKRLDEQVQDAMERDRVYRAGRPVRHLRVVKEGVA